MGDRKVLGLLGGLVVAALLWNVQAVAAQSISAEAGQQFLGRWVLELEPMQGFGGGGGAGPGGGGGGGMQPMILEIASEDGMLAAELTGGRGPMSNQPREISNISQAEGTLVLSYSMAMGGNSVPATIRLTPDGETMKVQMGFGDQFTRDGTARRE